MKNNSVTNKWLTLDRRGITLTELIVASVMIGIVMIGVASFGTTIKQLQGSTSRSVVLGMKVKAAMARMTEDAYATIGDNENLGYVAESPGGNDRGICFRHDIPPPNSTPEDYTDDSWVCYYRHNATDTLYRCPNPTAIAPNNLGQCGPGNKALVQLSQNDFFNIVETPIVANDFNPRLDYFELYIFTRYNPAIAMDPISNPDYSVSAQVSPPGQSR